MININMILPFQSTLPVRGATGLVIERFPAQSISIHAPREGSDFRLHPAFCTGLFLISIHAPREGSDH